MGDREMEEYLRQRRQEKQREIGSSEKEVNESVNARFRNTKGGLLEDGFDDYYAAPDIEKMKEEIIRIENERRAAQERLASAKPTEKSQKSIPGGLPAQPKRIDASNPPGYVVTALQSQTINNPGKSPVPKPNDSLRGKPSHNDSGVDVFQRSDFFNDFGSPMKQVHGRPPTGQRGPREESFFDGERSSRFIQGGNTSAIRIENQGETTPVHSMPIHPKLVELEKENRRLKSENVFLSKEKTALDSKLQEVLTGTVKSLKEELMASGSSALLTKVKVLENDLKIAESEKEAYFSKYKEIYERYQKELEGERVRNKSILDPKRLLELSKVNTSLLEEKKVLEKELREEREKSRNLTQFKDEFEKTKLELEAKANTINLNGNRADFRSADIANNSILRPLRQENDIRLDSDTQIDPNLNRDRDSRLSGTYGGAHGLASPKAMSQQTTQIGKDHREGPLSQVHPIEQLESSKLDESDLDFLGNFQKELDLALNKIQTIDNKPYNYATSSIYKPTPKASQTLSRWQGADRNFSRDYILNVEPVYGRYFGAADRVDDQDIAKSLNLEETGRRSSSLGPDGFKSSARFGTQSTFLNMVQDSARPNNVNFFSFNPKHRDFGANQLTSTSKGRYSNPNPEWFGYSKRRFPQPERGSTANLLEPFQFIYDEIPLPKKPVAQSHGWKAQPLHKTENLAFPSEIVKGVRPKVTDFRGPSNDTRSVGTTSLAASQTGPAPPSMAQTRRGAVDPLAVLAESPINLLNFKACSVFPKGTLFIAKGAFEISAKTTVNDRRDAAEVSVNLTLKSLKDNLVLDCRIVQDKGKLGSSDIFVQEGALSGRISLNKGGKAEGVVSVSLASNEVSSYNLCYLEITNE